MGKKTHYPKYVSVANGRVVYRPYIKKSQRGYLDVDKNGFISPPVRLGSVDNSYESIMENYALAQGQLKKQAGFKKNTLGNLADQYFQSREFKKLAPETQENDHGLIKILSHEIEIGGRDAVLGDLHITQVTKPIVRRIMEKRLERARAKGNDGKSICNREVTLISTIIRWAMNYIDGLGITHHPLTGIYKFKENVRNRYVSDEEFMIQREIATPDYLPVLFDITYLIASRSSEALDIKIADLTPDGVIVHRKKGSKNNLIEWSEALWIAVNDALELRKSIKVHAIDPHLFVSKTGDPIPRSTIDTAMQRLKTRMTKAGKGEVFWTMHDLKRKGISDAENGKIGGHKTDAMITRYSTRMESYKPPK